MTISTEEPTTLQRLILLMSDDTPSFCYYKSRADNAGNASWMSLDVFSAAVRFANERKLSVNILYREKLLPVEYEEILKTAVQARILPCDACDDSLPDVETAVVFDSSDLDTIRRFTDNTETNAILRVGRADLDSLAAVCSMLLAKCKRINLILANLDTFTESDLEVYAAQLDLVRANIRERLLSGTSREFSVLTDRLLLSEMRNCDAGLTHLTVAPNGKFYICPGFYYETPEDTTGDVESGIRLGNPQLLDIKNAPVCSPCDAYHCKRCVFLNRKLTLEVNTPSWQQCVASHKEREVARVLAEELLAAEYPQALSPIPELNYEDPFTLIEDKLYNRPLHKTPLMFQMERETKQEPDVKELLLQIVEMQKEILRRLPPPPEG